MKDSVELDLKTSYSILNDVIQEIEPLKQAIERQDATLDSSTWEIFKGEFAIGGKTDNLLTRCQKAISLATNVKNLDQNAELSIDGDTFTPDSIIAAAHIARGVVQLVNGRAKDAQTEFENSMRHSPTPDAQLRLGFTVAAQGLKHEAIAAFQRVIDKFPSSEEAVDAKKAIMDLEGTPLRKWNVALFLSIVFGIWGFDRFYLGYFKDGLIKLFTGGGFIIWWLMDIIKIAGNSLLDANGMKLQK